MKKIAQNRVITRIETSVRFVVLAQAPIESPFLYYVTEYSKRVRDVVTVKYFYSIRDAENYLFENYVYMIIPSDRFLNEGSHVFLY